MIAIGANLQISNNGPLESVIDSLYFDPSPDGVMTGIAIISESSGVDFQQGANPSNLPSGNNAIPPFGSLYAISANSGNAARIDRGESIVVGAIGGVLSDLFNSGSVRVGFPRSERRRNGSERIACGDRRRRSPHLCS